LPNGKLGALEYFFRHRRLSSTQEYEAIADDVAAAIAELRALREENAALRRVAEAAERARNHGFGSLTDWGESCHVVPRSHWAPLLDALADWRRVRGEGC
ncbi:MAG TPA: hypothetical protein VF171_06620, partial [Trueperaceae bacterium]